MNADPPGWLRAQIRSHNRQALWLAWHLAYFPSAVRSTRWKELGKLQAPDDKKY